MSRFPLRPSLLALAATTLLAACGGGSDADPSADAIARIRATDEAREGLTAFLEKRKASWT